MQDFHDLKVWAKGHKLALDIYRTTASFPREELYGITSQLRRASYSIPSNIAEGCGRGGFAEFARFLQIAMGSASETEYFLLFAYDLGFLSSDDYNRMTHEVQGVKRMLTSLIQTVKQKREHTTNGE